MIHDIHLKKENMISIDNHIYNMMIDKNYIYISSIFWDYEFSPFFSRFFRSRRPSWSATVHCPTRSFLELCSWELFASSGKSRGGVDGVLVSRHMEKSSANPLLTKDGKWKVHYKWKMKNYIT